MALGDVPSIHELDFSAELKLGETPELHLTGNAVFAASSTFEALVGKLHDELHAARASSVVVDMKALEFMSASAFNAIVSWLQLVQELPPEQRYTIRFRSNADILWQRRSLRTLSCFATDLITVES